VFRLARLEIVLLLSLVLASFAPLSAARAQSASSPTLAATVIPVAGAPGAERINFAPGGTSATRQNWIAAGTPRRYVFRAGAGQVAQIDVFGNAGNATMAIYGANGRVVLSQAAGLASFRGPLPSTQDYFIDVVASSGPPVNYTLQLIIPQRIRFARGAVSASLPGYVPANGTHNYILRAAAGQLMTVNVRSAGQVILIVYGNDGTVLQTDHVGSSTFTGRLPYTEDYFLDVRSVTPAGANYRLDVRITY
jgi:hypothetical protein